MIKVNLLSFIVKTVLDKPNIMAEMYKMKNAIKGEWKEIMLHDPCKLQVRYPPKILLRDKILDMTSLQPTKLFYLCLIHRFKEKPCAEIYWREIFRDKNICWNNVYREKLKEAKEEKIIAFNFKVLNNILATPYKLCKWKINNTNIIIMSSLFQCGKLGTYNAQMFIFQKIL